MLPVSLDCPFLLPVRYSLTFICLCLVYPMLTVSLDCPFLLPVRYSLSFICPVSCVPYVASFSGLSFFITRSVFSNIYLVLCLVYPMLPVSLDCPFLLPVRYSLTFICPVSCVPYVASFSGLSFFITRSVFSNIYLSCVLCTLCCQFLWIVLFYYPFGIL